MKSRFTTFALAFIIFLAIIFGAFWIRLSANEAPVSISTAQNDRGLQGGSRDETDVASLPTLDPTVTPANTFTPFPTITNTPPPGASLTPTAVPTARPENTPTSAPTPVIETFDEFDAEQLEADGIPTPVALIEMPKGVTNILLIGSDSPNNEDPETSIRTDSLLIASINRDQGTASLLSIPRDLYVFVPGWANTRINTAYAHGNQIEYEGGGIQLLKDTVLYNFGIPIHYYAQIDFSGFEGIVDSLGGVEVVNSCQLTDWILKQPGLDIDEEDNWEMFTLEPGVHQMDGFTALWYARSRRTTSDFDRGRRQQQLIDAIFEKGTDLNLIAQAPAVWNSFQETVTTDMDLGKALQLAAVASSVQENGIQHLSLTRGEIEGYAIPDSGASVSRLVPDEARKTFSRLYDVSELNQSARSPITIEIVNGSTNPELTQIVADTLEWFGIIPIVSDEKVEATEPIQIEYYGENFKGSYSNLVSWIFGVRLGEIELISGKLAPYKYRVVLGDDYSACRNALYAPRE